MIMRSLVEVMRYCSSCTTQLLITNLHRLRKFFLKLTKYLVLTQTLTKRVSHLVCVIQLGEIFYWFSYTNSGVLTPIALRVATKSSRVPTSFVLPFTTLPLNLLIGH